MMQLVTVPNHVKSCSQIMHTTTLFGWSQPHADVVLQVLGAKFLAAARSSLSMSGAGASQELQQLAQDASEPLLGLGVSWHRSLVAGKLCHGCVAPLIDALRQNPRRFFLNNSFRWSTGRLVASSIFSSSSLALTGGIGIMRLCLGELAFRT